MRPVLLDVSRLVSRAGTGSATGIDRVELAYMRELLGRAVDLHGLCRTSGGFALLDRGGLQSLMLRVTGRERWGTSDLSGRLSLKLPPARRAAESDVRRFAVVWTPRLGLGRLLRKRLPSGTVYLNVGHSNLSERVFRALSDVRGTASIVLVHDVIPLRLPSMQRPEAVLRFDAKLTAVARHGGLVVSPSQAERGHLAEALSTRGRVPPILVAPLGVERVAPDIGELSRKGRPDGAYFVALGTIEPRKNLGVLLDVWEDLAAAPPDGGLPALCIVGRRGWESEAFFKRLDALTARCTQVHEYGPLPDGAAAALLSGARALLFPSIAEGYGLPPLEALSHGVTPVCAPLDVYRETMADRAVYADPGNMYLWRDFVMGFATRGSTLREPVEPPTWDQHFNLVFAMMD